MEQACPGAVLIMYVFGARHALFAGSGTDPVSRNHGGNYDTVMFIFFFISVLVLTVIADNLMCCSRLSNFANTSFQVGHGSDSHRRM